MMTFEERVLSLNPLGFPRRQTEFIATVALHGGYCLQRQFDTFAERAHGQVARDFFQKLLTNHLATQIQLTRNRGFVYHLHAKPIYRAIGQADNRNRRPVSSAYIARKLMVLDYVLANRSWEWLATEQDKVEAFTKRFGVSVQYLPQRNYDARRPTRASTHRHFVHKLPIAVNADPASAAFVYLALDESGAGLETFIKDHIRLLARLSTWRIIAIWPPQVRALPACQRVYARIFTRSPLEDLGELTRADVLWFLRAREDVEREDLRRFSVPDLDRFRELRRRLSGPSMDLLFTAWQRQGDVVLSSAAVDQARGSAAPSMRPLSLVGYELPFRYEQFGSLPGIA